MAEYIPLAVDGRTNNLHPHPFQRRRGRERELSPDPASYRMIYSAGGVMAGGHQGQVEIKGIATLCLEEGGNLLQGSITTEDDSQYAIYATTAHEVNDSESTNQNELASEEGVPVTFDIRIVDCEVGEEYSLKKVNGRNGNLITFACHRATFNTEKVYRGQKADLIAQKCLGHTMGSARNQVFRGPITLQLVQNRRNSHWVL